MHSLPFPAAGNSSTTVIDTRGPVIIVGPNGAGKSRLGAWIEEKLNSTDHPVLRISAQKSLKMPGGISLSSPDVALEKWTYGTYSQQVAKQGGNLRFLRNARFKGRWGDNPVTGLLNDYESLVEFLLAEHATEILQHSERIEAVQDFLPLPETRLRRVKRIWEELLPGRTLLISTGKIQTESAGGTAYNGAEMSDGERVVFYMVASCISVKANAVLLIDEPELHLHRLIQRRLWDAIERERGDCLFVYFTHDLEFAASRTVATRIALQNFDGAVWNWTSIPENTDLPEDVLLSILGSRKPVLFVEGDGSSLDVKIYSQVYPHNAVVPVGSCGNVIASTVSFDRHNGLHRVESKGLVDQDQRTEEERARLEQIKVYTTGVSEAENLLILPAVLKCVADLLHRDNVDELIQKTSQDVIEHLNRDRDRVVTTMLNGYLEERLTKMRGGGRTDEDLTSELRRLSDNVKALSDTFRQRLNKVIEDKDYEGALMLYPNKGLSSLASKHFGVKNYRDEVLRLLNKPVGAPILFALRSALPSL
jgi:hypothetical protein